MAARREKDTRATTGTDTEQPTQVPPRGWWQILRRAYRESNEDNVSILAAAVAHYSFLSLFPALIAGISLWGIVVTPARAAQQAEALTADLPPEAAATITQAFSSFAEQDGTALGFGFALTVLLALWSASGGVGTLIKAVNIAYDEKDDRGFIKSKALSLVMTIGAIVFVILSLGLVAVVPPLINAAGLGPAGTILAQVTRFLLLVVLVSVALALIYRVAPSRADAKIAWVSPGALVAAAVWLLASIGFSVYVSNFGSYNTTYGSLAGVVILLLWLYLTAFIILMGAEINAESERQTAQDTTTGPPRPIGEREAYVADQKAVPSS